MKSNEKTELAIKKILSEQKNVASHIMNLDEKEKRLVLMYIANFCASAGYHDLMMESVEILGFRNEEVLIFCTATIGGGRPQLVPELIEKFCDNTAIAQQELSSCARIMIHWAEQTNTTYQLREAVKCVKLLREEIKPTFSVLGCNHEATNLVRFILYTNEIVRDQSSSKFILEELRKLVHNDDVWKWLQANKCHLGGTI